MGLDVFTVSEKLGVLRIILIKIVAKDVRYFLAMQCVVAAAFAAAFMLLLPGLRKEE